MLKLNQRVLKHYVYAVCNKINKVYKNIKIITPITKKTIFVHNGNSIMTRTYNSMHIRRSIKLNVLFKKPLKRPSKK